MTKNELIEAINSTIVTNGQKGITAESLANILTEIVNASGEGSGGGGVTFFLGAIDATDTSNVIVTLTDEQKAHNAATFEQVKNASPAITASLDVTEFYSESMHMSVKASTLAFVCIYIPLETAVQMGEEQELFMMSGIEPLNNAGVMILSDGTVKVYMDA